MKISQIINTMEYELLECIECNTLTPMRNGLKQPLCSSCMRKEYITDDIRMGDNSS